jgi:outer membrane receptor protein involved in Fe transport
MTHATLSFRFRGAILSLLFVATLLVAFTPTSARASFSEGENLMRATFGVYTDMNDRVDTMGVLTFGVDRYVWRNLALGVEAAGYSFEQDGDDALGLGLNAVARWHFLNFNRASIFVDGGLGMIFANEDVPDTGRSFNFTQFIGPGVTLELTDRLHLIGGVRYQHISNAQEHRNPGVDALGGHIGMAWGF